MFNIMLRSAKNQIECAFGRLKAQWRILLRPMDLKFEDITDRVLSCFGLHNFCEEQNIEPVLADMDMVIIIERVNAPTKDIVYTTTRKIVESLEMQSHDILRIICRIMEKQS